ncbi:hypothetical protein CEUSTIGMA_g8169.t1 [Chlamydomonas eustigma]|uniref:Alpha-glucan water dikinase-like N-terminal Ig-like domain-containing protein n=1 Tax=Chlamydomonas eustigma TaxID=1157962 RepID=A0A250XCC7_9CHLO|nr:hypothetical protein CEUSTIGMA_g8169.t1 [Chlamydomonas eustigma]|eukprot:GAX80734.1 hypothetical protein CEUSTIGMA_g8169.t1 [Chlamydomonas eustigma]
MHLLGITRPNLACRMRERYVQLPQRPRHVGRRIQNEEVTFIRRASLVTYFRNKGMSRYTRDPELGDICCPDYKDTSPEMIAECQLRVWLGAAETRDLKTSKLKTGIKGAEASLAVCGTIVESNQAMHAVVAFVVKENSTSTKLPNLTLHWATSKRHGDQWVPPPRNSSQYPPKVIPEVSGSAWRTLFASHNSPDGKAVHVAMLQVTLEGILSSGGISFVLNSGENWMHNSKGGADWFVPLSGWLPITTDVTNLPDSELYPASLEPELGPKDEADRDILRQYPPLLKEVTDRKKAAESKSASSRADNKRVTAEASEAELKMVAAAEELRVAKQDILDSKVELQAADKTAGHASHFASVTKAAFLNVEKEILVLYDASATVSGGPGAKSSEGVSSKASPAPQFKRELERMVKEAKQAVEKAEALERYCWDQVLPQTHKALKNAEIRLSQATQRREAAEEAVIGTKAAAESMFKAHASVINSADAVLQETEAALSTLKQRRDQAAERVSSRLLAKQLLEIKRFIASEGPAQPLNLRWLLPSSMSGRNLPVVPAGSKLNIKSSGASDDEGEGGDVIQVPCEVEDLQMVARTQMRKWLGLSYSQELHVMQYKFTTQTHAGDTIPVIVWLTAEEEVDESGLVQAVIVVAVDQSAAGRKRHHSLQLHWGAAYGDGPAQLVSHGWRTSAENNWQSGESSTVTPFSVEVVLPLDIGRSSRSTSGTMRMMRKDSRSEVVQLTQGAAAVDEVEDTETEAVREGRKRAAAVAEAASWGKLPASEAPLKLACTAVLQLPLSGVLGQGGFTFTLKGAKGNHLLNATTGQAFYVSMETLAQYGLGSIKMLTSPPTLPTFDEATSEEEEAGVSARAQTRSDSQAGGLRYGQGTSGYLLGGEQQGEEQLSLQPWSTAQEVTDVNKGKDERANEFGVKDTTTVSKQSLEKTKREAESSVNDRPSSRTSAPPLSGKGGDGDMKRMSEAPQEQGRGNTASDEEEAKKKTKKGRGDSLDRFKWF